MHRLTQMAMPICTEEGKAFTRKSIPKCALRFVPMAAPSIALQMNRYLETSSPQSSGSCSQYRKSTCRNTSTVITASRMAAM